MSAYNKKKFEKELFKVKQKNKIIKWKQKIKAEKKKYKRKIETSKIFAFYLFLLFNAIIVYSMYVMWSVGDLSELGVLITSIAAEVLTYAIYCAKAYYGKKEEEKVKYIRDKHFSETNEEPEDMDIG